jgi:SAM-dependent methyltransferase
MMQEHNQATQWFEEVYKKHKDNHENIPWARGDVNPLLRTYLEDTTQSHKGRALVVGCGLGDDAHALFEAGYEVLAIDVSQTALDIAKERSNGLSIVYEKQDIFDMPTNYNGYFDFVFEALTIQSLPVKFREKMIEAVANTLAPKGRLLVVAHQKQREFDGPPWPLTKEQIDIFKEHGLDELSFEIHTEESKISNTRFRVLYEKMEDIA